MKIDYYLVVIAFTVITSIVLIILIADNNRLPKYKKYLWISSIGLFIPASVSEYLGVFLNGAAESTRTIHILLKIFELSVSPIIVILLITSFNGFNRAEKLIPIAVINLIMQIVTGFTGFLYYFDENNIYHHNSFYWLYTVVYVVCGLVFFYNCIQFSRHYQNRNIASLAAILIFLVFGLSIHIMFSGLRTDWLALSIASSLFYNYYNALTEQTDSLTHLLDRKSYDNSVKSLNRKAVVIMFDVDRFKEVNDTYGHNTGDLCLQTVADVILNTYKRYGYCYRIGGDEFCVITGKKVDIESVNRLFYEELKRMRSTPDVILPNVSLGYSEFDPHNNTIQNAINNADTQMYKVKNKSRI